jgi:hypothetical protein
MSDEKIKKWVELIRNVERNRPGVNVRAKMVGGVITSKLPPEVIRELNRESNDYLDNLAQQSIERQKRTR